MQGMTLRRRQREALTGLLWISPWLIGFVVFTAGPMLFSLGTSFTRFTLGKTAQFAGLDNYIRAFTADPLFWPSLCRTLLFTAVTVPLLICGALGVTVAFSLTQAAARFTVSSVPCLSWHTVMLVPPSLVRNSM